MHNRLRRSMLMAILSIGVFAQTLEQPARFLVKLGEDIGANKSRVGDAVTAVVISPERFLGGRLSGWIDRASPGVLRFTFDSLSYRGRSWPITSTITGFVNSIGHRSVDEQERPVRIADGALTSDSADFAIDEGAEFNLQVSPAERFRVSEGPDRRVEIFAGGEVTARSPAEGLWSIACDWQDRWPAQWSHAAPREAATAGEWTILRGELNACGGTWVLEDAYRSAGRVIEGVRRYKWTGSSTASKVTLSVRFQTGVEKSNVLLPGIIYYGNPSGARSGRVPVWTGEQGDEAIFEEHRYPIPFAYADRAALHTIPSPVPHANLSDQWWSLGVAARESGTELLLLSGPCASNGQRSVVKAQQRAFSQSDNAYLNVPPGAIVEKRLFIEALPPAEPGSGFRAALETSLALWQPFSAEGLPSIAEIVRAKLRYADTRWVEGDGYAGFKKYVDRTSLVMGWTGQAEALGYALQLLDPNSRERVQKSLDFLSAAEFYPGGFHNW